MGAIAIDCHHKETDERQDKRGVGGRERAKDYTLVDNHCLQKIVGNISDIHPLTHTSE